MSARSDRGGGSSTRESYAGVVRADRRLKDRHLLSATREAIADPFFRGWLLMDAMPDGASRIVVEE